MKQRGRRSADAMELATMVPTVLDRVERIKAPHELTDEETEVWSAVVNTEPADWFTASTVPLLTQYCRHVIHAKRVAELLEQATSDPNLSVVDYDRLLKLQERESRAIVTLATKMRLAQQSTTNHRGNKKRGTSRKPWES